MTDEVTFQPARPRRAIDEIISQIRGSIQRGELEPGDRLPSERALAEQFAVSRNTVREALRMLEISGQITLKKGHTGGAFITKLDHSTAARSVSDALQATNVSLSDFTEVRMWLEPALLRAVCERMTGEDLQALEDNVEQASKLSAVGDWERKGAVHVEFFNLLADATRNPVMQVLVRSLSELLREMVMAVGPSTDDDIILRSRRRLLGHLRKREAEKAVQEAERHLKRIHRMWLTGAYEGSYFRS
ncbi:FadR family transcriptional regulator [Amycolatopsis acidicola]|uniref:FadR family transcriptional regulator n=1 Tax=Amycolatopsis acidicola TaxID=2596893 RepID=A0A5N0VLI3_9PSEU|nr:GntR family transcriptional regulator [Amycolatopsis acidicola]KAA9166040.1 FadR family transcriptional regulator [Amycolatopsis acidicola]